MSATAVLCVGNSLTYYNEGLDVYLSRIGFAAQRYTKGGASLSVLWKGGKAAARIEGGAWDVVLLQEDLPETRTDDFVGAAAQFVARVLASGARPVLLMAWPYGRLGHCTMEEIARAHRAVADTHGIAVAPVGLAFEVARRMARAAWADIGSACATAARIRAQPAFST